MIGRHIPRRLRQKGSAPVGPTSGVFTPPESHDPPEYDGADMIEELSVGVVTFHLLGTVPQAVHGPAGGPKVVLKVARTELGRRRRPAMAPVE